MTAYADYSFYRDEYCGQLTEQEFSRWIKRSSAYIRRITYGRASEEMLEADTQEAVRMAACAVCDVMCGAYTALAAGGGRMVASENTDGYSVAYVNECPGQVQEETILAKCYVQAELYLSVTDLLYMGVD